MDTVPQIISTKDLAYLSDMFEWNYTALKQINHFINEVQDSEIKERYGNGVEIFVNFELYL